MNAITSLKPKSALQDASLSEIVAELQSRLTLRFLLVAIPPDKDAKVAYSRYMQSDDALQLMRIGVNFLEYVNSIEQKEGYQGCSF